MKREFYHKVLFFSVLSGAMLLLSCQKIIQLDLKDAGSQLVIEGNVTNKNSTQTVKLSKSVAVTDSSNYPTVSGATVTITTDGKVYKLTEKSPGTYTTNLKAQPTKTYQLTVITEGQTYTATSTMPDQVKLDSLGLYTTTVLNKDYQTPTVFYHDPANATNFYRFILTVNGVQSKNYFVYNDELTNGREISRNLRDYDLTLSTGTLVNIEMQCIDQNIYQYWNGLDQNENRGGASTTPANPISNISNGALGYFSAHTSQDMQFIVK